MIGKTAMVREMIDTGELLKTFVTQGILKYLSYHMQILPLPMPL
jgi:hypothetical protein